MPSGIAATLLAGFLNGPLFVALVGSEALFSARREPPGALIRRNLAWWAILLALRALLYGGLLERPWRFAAVALVAAFALLRIAERLLGLREKEAAALAGPLSAWLFLSPRCEAMPFAEFAPHLTGVLLAFTLYCILVERLGETLDRREPFGRFGGYPLILVLLSGLLVAAAAFRGLIG